LTGSFQGARAAGPAYNLHMLSERPLPADLADRLDAVCQAWSGVSDLAAIYLFGSRASGRGGPRSDGEHLAQAVRLRNILVHGCLDIDHGRLLDELDRIESTETVAAAIDHWLELNVDR
jgi:hypothetical protein